MRIRKKIPVHLNGTTFFIPDEKDFQKLSSKGFGYVVSKNSFALLSYEALYLQEKGKVEIFQGKYELTTEHLFRKREIDCDEYLVFKDLVSKGYRVKSGFKYGFSFRVYTKEKKNYFKDHAYWLVKILHDYEHMPTKDLASAGRVAHSTKKKVLLAVLDSEKSISYYEYEWTRV